MRAAAVWMRAAAVEMRAAAVWMRAVAVQLRTAAVGMRDFARQPCATVFQPSAMN